MSDRGSQSKKTRASAQKGTHVPRQDDPGKRRISRAEKEAKRQKQLRWGVGLAAVAVLAVLLGFATWDYIVKPRQVLATVDGTRIRREDYWKFRRLELYQQMSQYSQYSQLVSDQSQAQQYQSLALQAQAQFDEVWGSTNVNDSTLQQMIDNQIYVDGLEDFGLTITDEELERWTLNQFAPAEMPLIEPTVTPTYVPERAQWATETAEALIPTTEITPTVTAGDSTPIGGATPVTQASPITEASPITGTGTDASPVASPEATTSASASPGASPMASPEIGGASPIASPEASPVVTMEPTPTLTSDQALATAEAGFTSYQTVLDQANMSVDDYYRLSARPQLAQQKIRDALTADIGQTADQVHARHILVATEELANQLYTDITNGTQDFAAVAAQSSIDTATAPNGGDLGWFSQGVMVEPFEIVAFSTPAGTVAPPVQSEFGWHIIEVLEVQDNRALTDDQISQLQQSAVQNWLAEQQTSASISSVMEPTPTPAVSSFVPPVDAPPVPTETAFPEETFLPTTPEASPAASPMADAIATPEATPISQETATVEPASASPVVEAASPTAPVATPVASPESTPMVAATASPIGAVSTPAASPEMAESATPETQASPIAPVPGTTPAAVVESATPAPVAPTIIAEATPEATPIGGDQSTPAASPIASPDATAAATIAPVPGTTPAAIVTAATPAPETPIRCDELAASPEASPIGSPIASPVASPVASPAPCVAP